MGKYIDAEKLKAEIEKNTPNHLMLMVYRDHILAFIDYLQQEQPEIDLEKEIERFLESEESTSYTNVGGYDVSFKDTVKIARHFYELGLNARKEE